MFLAGIDLVTGAFNPPTIEDNEKLCLLSAKRWTWKKLLILKRSFWILVFIMGLYFASSPNIGEGETPGYRYLATLVPKSYSQKYRWWQSIGGILIVLSVKNSKDIQPLFTNAFAQYLGNISYAFYIVHGPTLHSLGYTVMKTAWKYTGKETMTNYYVGFLMGWLVIMPVVFWVADLFWRTVDVPCVRFARWVEGKCEAKSC
jgi:peptidoglycan/LPS O-acetylase OafA/YrhL